jgi:hypothetical protein
MKLDLHTHETVVLLAGLLGLLEQEVVRVIFRLDPSSILSPIFGSMVLGSIGVGLARGIGRQRQNGNGGNGGGSQ